MKAGAVTRVIGKSAGRWAPLQNVTICARALQQTMNRPANLPGFVVLYGQSGYGKSMAASYCANKYDGIYVECRSFFRQQRTFLEAILQEMNIRPERTIGAMMNQIAYELDLSQRPLILDEMDHVVCTKSLELVRDLHEMARTTILMVGEQDFPKKFLKASPRGHNRVSFWAPAQPATLDDSLKLAEHYCAGQAAEDLVEHFRKLTQGVHRYICSNLGRVPPLCSELGLRKIDLDTWGKREVYTGDAPRRPM